MFFERTEEHPRPQKSIDLVEEKPISPLSRHILGEDGRERIGGIEYSVREVLSKAQQT